MRRLILLALAVTVATLMGCAGNREAVLKATVQTRQDVFQVVQTSQVASEKALLNIEFPVKAFKARFVDLYIKHSNPPYTVIVNIDGQSIELTDEPVLEEVEGDFKNNPEAGTGWKYVFKKSLQLAPGAHRITIAVPQSDVVVEKELTLNTGENLLKLTPTYIASISRYSNYPRFSLGLRGVTVQLNSNVL
ncbi:MAG: hypothetical protein WC156_09335 [Pedobacter sp.]